MRRIAHDVMDNILFRKTIPFSLRLLWLFGLARFPYTPEVVITSLVLYRRNVNPFGRLALDKEVRIDMLFDRENRIQKTFDSLAAMLELIFGHAAGMGGNAVDHPPIRC